MRRFITEQNSDGGWYVHDTEHPERHVVFTGPDAERLALEYARWREGRGE